MSRNNNDEINTSFMVYGKTDFTRKTLQSQNQNKVVIVGEPFLKPLEKLNIITNVQSVVSMATIGG